MDPDEQQIADAYAELRQANDDRQASLVKRDQSLAAYSRKHPEIARIQMWQKVHAILREAGWTDIEIVSVGASAATVRTAIERPRT